MIRTLAIAAAAAAIGYAIGQRSGADEEKGGSHPEITPEDVEVEDDEWSLSEGARRNISSDIAGEPRLRPAKTVGSDDKGVVKDD